MNMEARYLFRRAMLAISLVTGFVFLASFTAFYVKENYGVQEACSCDIPIYLIIIIFSSAGVFVGTLTYYLLTQSFIKEKRALTSDILKTLDFLDADEKTIMEAIIRGSGKISQNRIARDAKIDRVKVFRKISSLERKGVITKERHGMTNMIMLNGSLRKVFLSDG